MTKEELRDKITAIFQSLFPSAKPAELDLVPQSLTDGKLYEAYVLSAVSEKLVADEGFALTLVNGSNLQLKSSPGPINRRYPHIEASRAGSRTAEIWTDIEYLTLSYSKSGRTTPRKGDYHELDIVMVDLGLAGRPGHDSVWLGVECKNTVYDKGLLKDILGVRRELSFITSTNNTNFRRWPRRTVPAEPASCLLVYSSEPEVLGYGDPGEFFGIDFFHEPLPG